MPDAVGNPVSETHSRECAQGMTRKSEFSAHSGILPQRSAMSGRITVIGSANVDFFMRVPHLPARGESVNGGPFSRSFGGKGSNQALSARRSGSEVAGVFALGDDAYARELLSLYAREGIDASHVKIYERMGCGTGIILVDAEGDNAIATDWGANGAMTPGDVDRAEEAIAASDMIMLQMEIPDPAVARGMELAVRHGVPIMLNYAPARPSDLVLTPEVDILVVNESEASILAGMTVDTPRSAGKAAKGLLRNGHRVVIVTLGAAGCWVAGEGMDEHIPAFSVQAKDATAAGDTFCGALASAITGGLSLARAIRYANAAGALCVGVPGALPSIPGKGMIDDFLRVQDTEHYT